MLIPLIVWYHILSHWAIFVIDYSQVVPLLDFATREDGSASDPINLLPLELVYAGITAMSFGTIGAAYLLAILGIGTLAGAASLSVFFHGVWVFHMVWRWETWRAMMHPDGTLTPEFFLIGHLVWTLSSAFVVYKSAMSAEQKKTKIN